MDETVKIEPMTLGNVGEGGAEEAFQSALLEIADILARSEEFRTDAKGKLKVGFRLDVDFVHDEDGKLVVSVSHDLKRPKARGGFGWVRIGTPSGHSRSDNPPL